MTDKRWIKIIKLVISPFMYLKKRHKLGIKFEFLLNEKITRIYRTFFVCFIFTKRGVHLKWSHNILLYFKFKKPMEIPERKFFEI